jgi:hypothetical protein
LKHGKTLVVPFPRRHIEGKFNKILDALEKLSLRKILK